MQPPNRPGFPPYGGSPPYGGPPPYPPPPRQGGYGYPRGPPAPGPGPYGRPAPRMPPPGPLPRVGGDPAKNTTLWVGKIAESIEPHVVRSLLDACGPLRDWKPATDPKTGALKGFGFCTYKEAEGVIVALEVLNELVVDGQALALKCNSATDLYIKWYKENKGKADGEGAPAEPQGADAWAAVVAAARDKVQALIADRPQVAPVDAAAAAKEFMASFGGGDQGGSRRDRGYDRDRDYRSSRDRERDRDYRDRDRSRRHRDEEDPPPPAPPAVQPKPLAPRPLRKRPLATAFDEDEEEEDESEKKSRKLIPIQYSAEELKSMHEGGTPAVPPPPARAADPAEERKKRVMAAVPKDKDALFAYEVKWELLDRAPQEVKSKLAGWINKKIKDLVGDDAESAGFAEFIVSEVQAHRGADKILDNVQDVLDEDAVPFVTQLFKLVVFQTELLAAEAREAS